MRGPVSIAPDSWTVNPFSWKAAERLAAALDLSLAAAMVLVGRGIADPAEARMFLDCTYPLPDPFLFEHMQNAVETISGAIVDGRRVVVHGDYDADGITGTALMLLGLRDLGLDAEWYLPNRFEEGYGLSRRAIESIAVQGPGILITVDCGVNYPDEVAFAQESGLEVVVVDHHAPGPRLPECALVHPVAGKYPSDDLCGVGLALKTMHALHITLKGASRDALPEALRSLLDLVAIGTIADLAPLRGENRYYVREGLKLIAIGSRLGVRALASISGCVGAVDSGSVAYRLAPRLNAAGRLADPTPPLRLLLTQDESEASALATHLHELNGARQDVERRIFDKAVRQVEDLPVLPPIIVLAEAGWHEGVVGIVASRMVERYHRPAVLLEVRDGVAKGSGRSIPGYDLLSGLVACEHLLTVFGGHTQAVGLTLGSADVGELRTLLEGHAGRSIDPANLAATYRSDVVLRGEEVSADTAQALATLGPFGSGNPRPRVLLVDALLRDVETTRNGAHLRCAVEVGGFATRAIGFGMGEHAEALRERPERCVIGGQLRVDEWRGVLRPELLLERVGAFDQDGNLSESASEEGGCSFPGEPAEPPGSDIASMSRERGAEPVLPPAHDLRDRGAGEGALAQVVASRETTMLLVCSIPHMLPLLRNGVSLGDLSGGRVAYFGRACRVQHDGNESERVTVVEWDLGIDHDRLASVQHVVAIDPPWRSQHVDALWDAQEKGATVHLFYGQAEREATAGLLKYLVHPRFAMVCLYRALQEATTAGAALYKRAAEIGWREAQIVLSRHDLERAQKILDALGVEQHSRGEGKLEARSVAAYAAAEAEYEECVRLCRTL